MGGPTKTIVTPAGRVVEAPAEAVDERAFGREATPEEVAAARDRAAAEERYGGIVGGLQAGAEGFLSGASMGLYDVLGRAKFGEEFAKERNAQREVQPVTSTVGEVAGQLLGPAKGTQGINRAVAAKAGGGFAGAAIGGAAEGAVVGLGEGAKQIALSDDPLNVERAASTLSSNVLFGAGIGGGAGGAAHLAEQGLVKAKGLVDEARARFQKGGEVAEEFAGKGKGELREIAKAETEALKVGQVAEKAKTADDLAAYRASMDDANPWIVAEGEPRAVLTRTKKSIRNALDNPEGLKANPGKALDPLQREAEALKKLIAAKEEIGAKIAQEELSIAKEVAMDIETLPAGQQVRLTGKAAKRYGAFSGSKVGKDGIAIEADEAARFRDAITNGETSGQRAAALQKLDGVLEQNQALQARIKATYDAPKSPRLEQIQGAMDAVDDAGTKKGALERMVEGSVYGAAVGALPAMGPLGPVLAPMLGAKASGIVTDLVFGRMGAATKAAADRSAAAAKAFINVGERVTKAAPPLATKVLSSLRYAPSNDRKPPDTSGKMKGEPSLVTAYKDREREIRSQVMPGPDGMPVMRPEGRRAISDRLGALRAMSPMMADQIETIAARKIEFLASKLPTKPDYLATSIGPDRWRPSDMEMRAFARDAAAAEDPGGVEERVVSGQITPEDSEAYKAIYPERFESFKRQILEQLPELRESLPYERQISLSIFTGIPVDPAMRPETVMRLQGSFAAEAGTEGGQMAPRARPQFGSVKNPETSGTPSQARAE